MIHSRLRSALRRYGSTGFTLVELLVVTAISLMIMSVGGLVYMNCMKVYEEGQGLTQVHETAKLIERDLRDYFTGIVPVKGSWIKSSCVRFPGGDITNVRNFSYYTYGTYGHGQNLHNTKDPSPVPYGFAAGNPYFSGAQYGWNNYDSWNHVGSHRGSGGTYTASDHPCNWGGLGMALWITFDRPDNSSWWPPAFYGKSDGTNATQLANNDNQSGSWGWPRPDYRMEADANDIKTKSDIACWFYTEDRDFNSPLTLTLDNPNLVLASLKFTVTQADNREVTMLSMIKHHIGGWDHPGKKGTPVRNDMTYGNMLRAIRIVPYCLKSGVLTPMSDADLGCDRRGTPVAGGNEVPRCFDAFITLKNPWGYTLHEFAYRFYTHTNPQ